MEIAVSLLIVLIPLTFKVWQYLDQRKRQLQDARFEVFHRLIRDLVEPSSGARTIYLDRQIAVVFELRNFPEYAEVSERILRGLQATWSRAGNKHARLLAEIDFTLHHLPRGRNRGES